MESVYLLDDEKNCQEIASKISPISSYEIWDAWHKVNYVLKWIFTNDMK